MQLDVHNRSEGKIPVSYHPDLLELGYKVIHKLGCNREGERVTYLANDLKCDRQVVIKQFRLTSAYVDWSGVKAYEHEVSMLQQLNHARIPQYKDSFEKSGFFYIVQEYKNAPSLGANRSFHPEEIKQIALSILEILVYLQKQATPIIHRDIKPENILIDEQLNAYLVDFGLARIQGEKMPLSSFVAGTPGFIPPEEHFGYALTKASDLYSLGATLICLLTGTRAVDISKLIDDKYRFHVNELLPQLNPRFRLWLMKMVERNRKHRYANATAALKALKLIQPHGSGNRVDHLVATMKLRKKTTMLGLATIGTLAAVGASLMIAQPGDAARQLLETKERQPSYSSLDCSTKN